jgi:hypothetical protein
MRKLNGVMGVVLTVFEDVGLSEEETEQPICYRRLCVCCRMKVQGGRGSRLWLLSLGVYIDNRSVCVYICFFKVCPVLRFYKYKIFRRSSSFTAIM